MIILTLIYNRSSNKGIISYILHIINNKLVSESVSVMVCDQIRQLSFHGQQGTD